MKLRRLVVALGVIGIGVVAGCGISTPSNRGAREVREALLKELEPVALTNCTLKRYGSPNDGGYLMCENLVEGVQSAYSYGIASEDNWGCDVSRQFNVAVHQYDCFTAYRPVCDGGRFVFHDECVGARAETLDGQPFDTFGSHVVRNGDANKSLLVKLDIEGAEWDSLMATPDELLNNIAQMPMELHGADERKFLDVVRRLKRHFYLVNLHFNNWSCSADAAPLPATVYQVLWVNKRIGQIDESSPSGAPMSTLNAPDGPNVPDCQLR